MNLKSEMKGWLGATYIIDIKTHFFWSPSKVSTYLSELLVVLLAVDTLK